MSDQQGNAGAQGGNTGAQGQQAGGAQETASIVTRSALRIGLALFGLVVLLFALSQAFGVDLISPIMETQMGQWLVVAFVAFVLILIALGGWGTTRR
jgi:hypothetical protein